MHDFKSVHSDVMFVNYLDCNFPVALAGLVGEIVYCLVDDPFQL